MTFQELLRAHPYLRQVNSYYLKCNTHGTFWMLANGLIPDRCPRCGQPTKVGRPLNMNCATRRPVPLVQRWKSDNADVSPNTRPAWFRQGEIEDC